MFTSFARFISHTKQSLCFTPSLSISSFYNHFSNYHQPLTIAMSTLQLSITQPHTRQQSNAESKTSFFKNPVLCFIIERAQCSFSLQGMCQRPFRFAILSYLASLRKCFADSFTRCAIMACLIISLRLTNNEHF